MVVAYSDFTVVMFAIIIDGMVSIQAIANSQPWKLFLPHNITCDCRYYDQCLATTYTYVYGRVSDRASIDVLGAQTRRLAVLVSSRSQENSQLASYRTFTT